MALGRQKTDVLADLPPHITLLYPLPGTHRIDRRVLAEIAEALGAATPFSLRFEQTGRFPEVLYLEPTSPEPLVNLTRLLAGWFPDHPPYGGTYEEIVPHLSVVAHAPEPPGLEAAVRAHLPFDAASSEIWLVSLSRGGHWTTAERFQLGGR